MVNSLQSAVNSLKSEGISSITPPVTMAVVAEWRRSSLEAGDGGDGENDFGGNIQSYQPFVFSKDPNAARSCQGDDIREGK